MISIKMYRNDKGELFGFHIYGHAGYAEKGKDVVCAAVSSLSQAVIVGLEKLTSDEINSFKSKDDLSCEIILMRDKVKTQTILELLLLSLKDIESQYPEYVKISEVKKQ